jgi:hypothetical protein
MLVHQAYRFELDPNNTTRFALAESPWELILETQPLGTTSM